MLRTKEETATSYREQAMTTQKTGGFWIPSVLGDLLEEIKAVTPEQYKKDTLASVGAGETIIGEAPDKLVRILALAWEKQAQALDLARKAEGSPESSSYEDRGNRLFAESQLLTHLFWDDVCIQCSLWRHGVVSGIWIRKGNLIVVSRPAAQEAAIAATPKKTFH